MVLLSTHNITHVHEKNKIMPTISINIRFLELSEDFESVTVNKLQITNYKYIYSALNIYNNVYSLHNIQVRTLHSYSTMFAIEPSMFESLTFYCNYHYLKVEN